MRTLLRSAACFMFLVGTALVVIPDTALAQRVPTVETKNILQQIKQLEQMLEDFGIQSDQLDALLKELELIQKQLEKAEQTYAALTGGKLSIGMLMGGELDGLLDQEFTDALGAIQGAMKGDYSGLSGNNSGKMKSLMQQVLDEHGFDQQTLASMAASGNDGQTRVAAEATTGALISAAAQNSHEEAAQSLERVDKLVEMIPEMTTLKESVDHNTRVTAELAIAMTKMWELEAVQTIGVGQAGVTEASSIAEEKRYLDFTMPDME